MTVVDPLTDEEISVKIDDDLMTCWAVGWTATVAVSIPGVGSFVTTEEDLVDTLTEDGGRETLIVSIPCIVLLAAAGILAVALVGGTMVAVLAQGVLTAYIVVTISADIQGEGNTLLK